MIEIPEIDCLYDEKIRCDGPEHHCFMCNVPGNFDYKTIKEHFNHSDLKKPKIWCTECDIDLEDKGVALDCPEDGTFYVCPKCNYRIVLFEN